MIQTRKKEGFSEKEMNNEEYTIVLSVDQTPREVFDAINNVRGWWAGIWSGEIEGETNKLNGEFVYRVPNVHYSKQKIIEFSPNTKVVWLVLDANLTFTKNRTEWKGTKISFEIISKDYKTEIRFKHIGLVSEYECYNNCSNAWNMLINKRLKTLLMKENKIEEQKEMFQ